MDGSPVVAGNKVIIGSMDGKLYQVDLRTGAVITRYEIGASISAPFAVSNGWIFVGVRMETCMRLAQEAINNERA